ncbi:hypothetical protein [Pantoea vagans]|uniref:hypothetical protein n=1 Tax=Pantoea vagans TaxID=470934 RepID=UPI0023B06771|nr:hypothetical protein [Pantoea vagans]MDE8559268.1 hypothetical protein [Pantoea vagans]MDE8579268.1 hypothetical protein [Pantoea vagans]
MMEIQQLLTQVRAPGIVFKTFTQSAGMFKRPVRRRRPAFDNWLHQLSLKDRVPRGRYFRGKRPGKPLIIVDEFWQQFS